MKFFSSLGRAVRQLLLAPFLCLAACQPILVSHDGPMVEIQPTSDYYSNWSYVEDCAAGWTRTAHPNDSLRTVVYTDSLDSIIHHWIIVDGDAIYAGMPTGSAAAAQTRSDSILIADPYRHDSGIIRHEEIHALTERHPELAPGGNWHYAPLFAYCRVPLAAG